jgi:hypothetical protein
MAVTRSSVHVSIPLERLIEDLILSTTTLDRGLAELLPMNRKQVSLNRFFAAGDNLTARVPKFSNATPADAMTKDEKQILLTELQFSDEVDPVEFNQDWDFLWTSGASVESQPATELVDSIISVVQTNVGNQLERLIWQGDTLGAPGLDLFDGLIKKIDADGTVNSAAPLGVITSANIISVFESVVAAATAEMQELGANTILCAHTAKYKYREAARALDFKGNNITQAIDDVFGGYRVVSTHGIPDDRVFMLNANGGPASEIKIGTWMDSDRMNVYLAKASPLDDVWGIRVRFDIGVEYVYGKQIVEYSPA